MLTKQNALFVTVRQTPKVHERVHFRTPSHLLRVCLALCDEDIKAKDFLKHSRKSFLF